MDTGFFQEKGWLKLDNAAKLFPAIASNDLTSVFRITAFLREPVKYSAIKEASEITSKRFPYFSVSLRSGLFWHFLEFNNQPPRIQLEEEVPCTAFALKRTNESLYRIIIKGNRISVEFIHILTDGAGAMEYFKSLLYTYLTIAGKYIGSPGDIILPGTPFSEEEIEDGYNKFFRKLPPPVKHGKAWHLPFRLSERPRLRVICGELDVNEILEITHRHKVSFTEYFVSVYLFSLQEIFVSSKRKSKNDRRKILRVEVPVNLRNKFPIRTMRNFSLFVLPELDLRLGIYTFEEILYSVHHQLHISTDIKQISRFLSSNVSYEKHYILRILPLFIKKMTIAAIYRGFASKRFTGLMTNIGIVTLPGEMSEMIDSFELIPPPPNTKVKVTSAIVSYMGKVRICFSNITQSSELEQRFFRHLAHSGMHVKILNKN